MHLTFTITTIEVMNLFFILTYVSPECTTSSDDAEVITVSFGYKSYNIVSVQHNVKGRLSTLTILVIYTS